MTPAQESRLVALATRVYRVMLIVYPASFRSEYGPLMVQAFRDRCHDEELRCGATGLLTYWPAALLDLCCTALAEWETTAQEAAADGADYHKARVYRLLQRAGVGLLVGACVAMANIWTVEYRMHLVDVVGWLLLVFSILTLPLLPLMLTNLLLHGAYYRAARCCSILTMGTCMCSAFIIGAGTLNSFLEGGYHPDQGLWGGLLFTLIGLTAIVLIFEARRAIRHIQAFEHF